MRPDSSDQSKGKSAIDDPTQFCSDDEDNAEDEEDGDEDASAMAMAALSDISAVFKSPSKNSNRAGGGKSLRGPSQQGRSFGHLYQG